MRSLQGGEWQRSVVKARCYWRMGERNGKDIGKSLPEACAQGNEGWFRRLGWPYDRQDRSTGAPLQPTRHALARGLGCLLASAFPTQRRLEGSDTAAATTVREGQDCRKGVSVIGQQASALLEPSGQPEAEAAKPLRTRASSHALRHCSTPFGPQLPIDSRICVVNRRYTLQATTAGLLAIPRAAAHRSGCMNLPVNAVSSAARHF